MVSKKGALELGVNSIVILILALVILGLGIGFVTRLFMQGQDTLGGILDRDLLPIHADSTNPIQLEKDTLQMQPEKTVTIKVSVYNDGKFAATDDVKLEGDCVDEAGTDVTTFDFGSGTQNIPIGNDVGYVLGIRDTGGAEGNFICTVSTYPDGLSKQLFVIVQR